MPSLPGGLSWLALALGIGGLAWGIVSDRIAARWPAHEDGSVRAVDWRTPVVGIVGAVALAAVVTRYTDAADRLLFGVYFAALVLLLATDLDQRLLPDGVTLPLAGLALVAVLAGANPLLLHQPVWMPYAGAVVVPLALFALSVPFGEGALGIGDVKLLLGVGLLAGLYRSVIAVVSGAMLAGVVVVILLAARRITLKSFIPFGPFLILGAFWALLLPTAAS